MIEANADEIKAAYRRGRVDGMREAAEIAEADRGVSDCPYSNDKPGDPTWKHTDKDICPACHKTADESGESCLGVAKHRIAAAIRARAAAVATVPPE